MKQTEILTHATHVNGWLPVVFMSCMNQNFRLFHASNLSVRNFRIFLLMYTASPTSRSRIDGNCPPLLGVEGELEARGGSGCSYGRESVGGASISCHRGAYLMALQTPRRNDPGYTSKKKNRKFGTYKFDT